MDARDAAKRWAGTWERGWTEHDVDAILALYAPGVFWSQSPFRDPETPRGYLERVFTEEESAQCSFGEPLVDGDRAAVPWTGDTQLVDGGAEHLAGVTLLRFDADGLVVEQRDFWNEG